MEVYCGKQNIPINLELNECFKLEVRLERHQHGHGKWIHSFTQSVLECLLCDELCSRHWGFSREKQPKNLSPHTVCILVGVAEITQREDKEGGKIRAEDRNKNNTHIQRTAEGIKSKLFSLI